MEHQDEFSWERTAFREFAEEVGIELREEDVEILGRHKFNWADRQSTYFVARIRIRGAQDGSPLALSLDGAGSDPPTTPSPSPETPGFDARENLSVGPAASAAPVVRA